MSLLLDALKRAEQEKLAKQSDRPANDPPASSASSASSAATKREAANAAALELQPIASAGAAPGAAAQAKSGAATAQAVFAAKSAPSQQARATKKATALWIAGVVVVILIAGIGGYVWWSLTALQPTITTLRPRSAPTPPPASGNPLPNKLDTLVPGAIAPETPRSETPPGASTSTPTQPTTSSATPAAAPRTEESVPPARTTTELAARLVKDAPPTPSLRLAPTEKPRVPAEIAVGYEALRAGDLPAARRSYAAALAADPASLDAQLGLATIEGRLGNAPAAASHYRRALDLDPRNATALAGLASIADMSQPEILEGQLRADIGRYPQSAALHFALGNLYASRQLWEEAQGEYFEALRIEPASADTLYNLAVAMDHMRQSRLAADYYRRALDASRGQAAQFDPAAAQRRLAELRP